MHSLKQLIFPTFSPDNALILPVKGGGQKARQSYDYAPLVKPTINGQLHRRDDNGRNTEWDTVTGNDDNGKRQYTLTPYDNELVIVRELDPEKAAFLKPIWAGGHDRSTGTKVAHRNLKAAGQQTRGYSKHTVKKYWAVFNLAFENANAAHSPTKAGEGLGPSKGKNG